MSDLFISIAINVIKGFVFLYDVVTYIPRYVIEQPYKKLAESGRLRVCKMYCLHVLLPMLVSCFMRLFKFVCVTCIIIT